MRRAVLAILLCTSCKDAGVESHRLALEKYTACVERGLKPNDPCFGEVLTLLEKIPGDSKARARADALSTSLQNARQPKIRTPLAVPGGADEHLAECEKLAQQLGTTKGPERAEKLRALDSCRLRAEKHEDAEHAH